MKYEKLAAVVSVPQNTQNLVIHVVVVQRTAKKGTEIYNAGACFRNVSYYEIGFQG